MSSRPVRGFDLAEFEMRSQRAQRMMRELRVDALLLTTEPHVRYFSGFLTQFWLSPTRPWFLLLPLEGKPIAVIPSIGEVGMRETWLDDIRCWSSPLSRAARSLIIPDIHSGNTKKMVCSSPRHREGRSTKGTFSRTKRWSRSGPIQPGRRRSCGVPPVSSSMMITRYL